MDHTRPGQARALQSSSGGALRRQYNACDDWSETTCHMTLWSDLGRILKLHFQVYTKLNRNIKTRNWLLTNQLSGIRSRCIRQESAPVDAARLTVGAVIRRLCTEESVNAWRELQRLDWTDMFDVNTRKYSAETRAKTNSCRMCGWLHAPAELTLIVGSVTCVGTQNRVEHWSNSSAPRRGLVSVARLHMGVMWRRVAEAGRQRLRLKSEFTVGFSTQSFWFSCTREPRYEAYARVLLARQSAGQSESWGRASHANQVELFAGSIQQTAPSCKHHTTDAFG